jgi:ABC-type molybdate transport system permease subunit
LIDAATDPVVLMAIWISISAAICSTLIAFFFGVPLAYFLARKDFVGKSIIESIVDVPLVVPHIVAGIALYGVFMRYGVIGAPFEKLGIAFVDAFPGIVVAMLFVSLPFLVYPDWRSVHLLRINWLTWYTRRKTDFGSADLDLSGYICIVKGNWEKEGSLGFCA